MEQQTRSQKYTRHDFSFTHKELDDGLYSFQENNMIDLAEKSLKQNGYPTENSVAIVSWVEETGDFKLTLFVPC